MLQHEFRTPLSATIMLVTQLLRMTLDDEMREVLEIAHGTQQLLLNIVNGLLDFRNAQQGTFSKRIERFSPQKAIDLAMQIFKQEAAQSNTTLRFTVLPLVDFMKARSSAHILTTPLSTECKLPEKLSGDPVRMTQVIVNLVRNAMKFTERGMVRVLAAYDTEAEQLRFHVQDNGVGISKND